MVQRVGRGIALLFHDRGTRRAERSAVRPGRTLPPEKTRYPFTGGWVDRRVGLDGRKISSPPGFDPGPSSPWSVALPTELPGPPTVNAVIKIPYIIISRHLPHRFGGQGE